MDVKEAVKHAKHYAAEVFAEEGVRKIRLEEVFFEEHKDLWKITLGILREEADVIKVLKPFEKQLDYKVIKIHNSNGKLESIEMRNFN